ncbi:P-loop containing nucleoside triphosphatehydrolases superfamily protein [Striga asiatica]|uniref:P-loop containing nucleoside triphosphatehydrolases superfamily protein n=1 Tax=Striga asiatica TaxID=4170 RepID=A0A5A7Q299_STRAF|nr:P-loop containing nucleoside triphosphatehydrolases superfamily protein [Striga asiatica]
MEIMRWKPQKSLQDILATKASKRSPLILRMVILLFSVQIDTIREINPLKIQAVDRQNRACRNSRIEEQELPYTLGKVIHTFECLECACNPVRFFAIVSMQRSGSGWFETLLNSHKNLSSNGEIFGLRDRRKNVSVIYKTLDKGLMEYHKDIANYLMRRGVSIIFLFRRNLLRRMVSLLANKYDKEAKLLNGTHKSHAHTPHEAQILAGYKPSVNVTILVSTLRSTEKTVTKALESFKSTRHIVLYYENILANRMKLVDVQEFLKLPQQNLTSLQLKIHTAPLPKQIANFIQFITPPEH